MHSFKYLVKEGFRNLWSNRLMSFASIGVLICCLVLMGSAALISINISGVMEWLGDQNVVKVFLVDGLTQEQTEAMADSIRGVGNIKSIEFVDRKEAYESIVNRMTNNPELIMAIDDTGDFLPDAYTVTFNDLTRFEETCTVLENLENVYAVSDKRELAAKLQSINRVVTVVGIWIVGLLFLVSLFIITNTIKLTMYVRRLEISIMKSVGATDWFIRLPFLVEGMVIGFVSGLVSFGLIAYVYMTAASAVTTVLSFGLIAFSTLWHLCLLSFLLAGMLAGAVGSLISIRKYLAKEGGLSNA
ncbi:MAG: permease-like cell division protein FtsX [Clostridia bacterium]|nr:permease-like cell division protein FtsX [Clostridia bacterium]